MVWLIDLLCGSKDNVKEPQLEVYIQNWMYQYAYQVLTSTQWKVLISQFIDNNCQFFNQGQQSSHEQYIVFQKFIKKLNDHIENCLQEVNMDWDLFLTCIKKSQNSKNRKQQIAFSRVKQCCYFLTFKNTMIKRKQQIKNLVIQFKIEQKEKEKHPRMIKQITEKKYQFKKFSEKINPKINILIGQFEHNKLRKRVGKIKSNNIKKLNKVNLIEKQYETTKYLKNQNQKNQQQVELFNYNNFLEKKSSVNNNTQINQNKKDIKIYQKENYKYNQKNSEQYYNDQKQLNTLDNNNKIQQVQFYQNLLNQTNFTNSISQKNKTYASTANSKNMNIETVQFSQEIFQFFKIDPKQQLLNDLINFKI